MRSFWLLFARALFALFSLAGAAYGLLAYLPFTYHQVLACRLLPWLDTAARWHAWANLAAVAVLLALLHDLRGAGRVVRRAAIGLATVEILGAVGLILYPVLPRLRDDWHSLAWSGLALLPAIWLGILDVAARTRMVAWEESHERAGRPHLAAAWMSTLFVTLLYAGLGMMRFGHQSWREPVIALGWSLLTHGLVFLAVFLLLDWIFRLARLFRTPARVEFWVFHVGLAVAVAAVVETVAWPALGFTGWRAVVSSGALGLMLTLQNAAAALTIGAAGGTSDGVGLSLAPALLARSRNWATGVAAVAGIGAAGALLTAKAAAMDWNFTLQELIAAFVWISSFACFYGLARRPRTHGWAWAALPVALVFLYRGLDAMTPPGEAADRWAGANPSYRLTRAFLTVDRDHSDFYRFLGRNTSIPASTLVHPVEVRLTDSLERSAGRLPYIFILTIDSLRRDYLSPYNPKVTFTPAIDSFARESTVFRNAFTRYGGTGLSEPAIWAGAMLLHKQYVKPFRPMNALERLLEVENYEQLLSRDSILSAILSPSGNAVELDPPDSLGSYDLSRSLDRMKVEIDRRASNGKPLFGYTQPQNIHIAVMRREGATIPDGGSYPGFYAPYASRLRQVDQVFGQFIDFLKSRGLYDRSIVILTSDHGDSLGEDGRWGHAYTLYPEIVRIPLLIHLPPQLRTGVSCDPDAVAFNTDITPSLYYLLGHRPIRRQELFGTPLFTATPGERAKDPRNLYLLAASYGAVYGLLDGQGRRLYVADGVNYRSYLFEMNAAGSTSQAVSESIRRSGDAAIRNGILAINRFYRFGEQGTGQP